MRPLCRLAAGLAVLAGFLQPGLAANNVLGPGLDSGSTTSPAAPIGSSPSTVTGSTETIAFADTDFDKGVLVYAKTSKVFQFTINQPDITITQVQLYDATKIMVLGTYNGTTPTGQVILSMSAPTGAGTGSITIKDPGMLFGDVNADGDILYFSLSWTSASGVAGTTTSRTFGYAKRIDEVATLLGAFTNTQPAVPQTVSSTALATTTKSSSAKTPGVTSQILSNVAPSTTATSTTAIATATATNEASVISSVPQPTQSGTDTIKKKKSGLSGGAIAGIVVGVVAGIFLLLALLFVFLKHRKRATLLPVRGGDSGGDHGAALGGAAAAGRPGGRSGKRSSGILGRFASPSTKLPLLSRSDTVKPYRSPYGVPDLSVGDGATSHTEKQAAAARAMDDTAYGDSPVSYTDALPADTSDSAAAAPAAPEAPAAPAAAAAAGSPSSRPLVNPLLIEEDMTPEQIARVEAEERELDEAISHQQRNR